MVLQYTRQERHSVAGRSLQTNEEIAKKKPAQVSLTSAGF